MNTPIGYNFEFGPVKCSTHSKTELNEEIKLLFQDRSLTPRTITCINAHITNLARKNKKLQQYLNSSRIIAADGIAVVWASRFYGNKISERCNMTEAFYSFLKQENMPPSSGIIIGCTDQELKNAKNKIHSISKHCHIIATYSGYLKNEEYKELLAQQNNVDIILIGAGTPRSEELVTVIATWLPEAVVWHVGGGTIKMLAGTIIEAPIWMRKIGLQWLHRLLLEPVRMWSRYIQGNPVFIFNVIKDIFKNRKHTDNS